MHRPNLPNINGNLVITHSNVRSPTHPPNAVFRSWSSREVRTRCEDRLVRSMPQLGHRSGQRERRVLEWCKQNNVNMVQKLPKLDSAILTKGIDVDKFMTFVEEAPIVKKAPRAKPYEPVKERNTEKVAKSNYCQYCQREMPSTKHRTRRSVFLTSPYECEYCGASNDIDTDDNVSSMDSESCTSSAETVHDTIRRGNPTRVIDHRTFHEKTEKSAKVTEECDSEINEEMDIFLRNIDHDPTFHEKTEKSAKLTEECDSEINEEMDIFWRNDASEYFEHVNNVEDEMSNLSLLHVEQSVFLTEASVPANIRPSHAKIAWDDEDSTQFAEINRTIATDDGLYKKDVLKSEAVQSFERHSDNENMRSSASLFQENKPDMKIRICSRTQHSDDNHSINGESDHEEKQKGALKVTKTIDDGECNTNVNQQKNSFENATICSPVANQSVALSRLAFMRLSRGNRLRSKSSPGTRQRVNKED